MRNGVLAIKTRIVVAIFIVIMVCLSGCKNHQDISQTEYSFSELEYPQDYIRISSEIPNWVITSESNKIPIYAASANDMTGFNVEAKEAFPDFFDDMWTQEQNDSMYLGQGINVFPLDNTGFACAYYPIIYNGYVVSMLLVVKDNDNEYRCQWSTYYSNEFNILAQKTSEFTPLYLGIMKNNLIGIIGNEVFILAEDYIEHKKIDLNNINLDNNENIEVISVKDVFVVERTATIEYNGL